MSDPYPQYQLRTEKGAAGGYAPLNGSTKLANIYLPSIDHGSLTGLGDDDHPQYQLRSEKGMSNGYAPLDTIGVVPLVHLPADLVVASELAAHEAASDPHPGYQKESEKGSANGYASLDASGLVPGTQLPGDFFGWTSFASGLLLDDWGSLYTVPTGKRAKITFFSVKNLDASLRTTIEIHIFRAATSTETDIGSVELDYGEYVWYVDPTSEYWSLSEGDIILGKSTYVDISAFILLGAEVNA